MTVRERLNALCEKKILILDGPKGTLIQSYGLSEDEYRGAGAGPEADGVLIERARRIEVPLRGNCDILNITRPDIVRRVHDAHLRSGADILQTNTFNGTRFSQADFRASGLVRELNLAAARIAKEAAAAASTADKPRFVAGDLGPTPKTLSISPDVERPAYRSLSFDELAEAYAEEAEALMDGGVDLFLIETVFDTLNAKAAVYALKGLMRARDADYPVMISMTIPDASGRNLSGQTLEAFRVSLEHAEPFSMGLNCSLGAAQLRPFLEELSRTCPVWTSAHPNAGLPNGFGGYDQGAEEFARLTGGFCEDGLVNIVGGCCGSFPEHIAALARAAEGKAPRRPAERPETLRLAGLEPLAFEGELPFVNIGERTNVAGSRKFLRLIKEGKFHEGLEIALEMASSGSRMIDVCMDDAMLDAKAAMGEFLSLMASDPEASVLPVVIDSSDFAVIVEGLKRVQGKCLVNSISLKEGEAAFLERARAVRDLGAAAIVMLFDARGQADSLPRKIEIAKRSYDLLVRAGFPARDVVFDPNVLALATGMEEHRRYGLDFIEACAWIKAELPLARVSGGVSNLSFSFRGNEAVRAAMHAVFLRHAVSAGMDMAILNPAQLVSYDDIDPELLGLAEDVVLDRRADATERLVEKAEEFLAAGKGEEAKAEKPEAWRSLPPDERLAHAVVKGVEGRVEEDIAELLPSVSGPLAVIEGPLMKGMDRVGELFGSGRMFLPQVIKSARVMKRAVAYLEPLIKADRSGAAAPSSRGKILLATVKGDVHDIGKNIVGVVLACNGYEVKDLGVMVPSRDILDEAKRGGYDVVGVSGLITPSLAEMAEIARMMEREGFTIPLLVGGATTSPTHTAVKIAPEYSGGVIQVRDASKAVQVVRRLMDPKLKPAFLAETSALYAEERAGHGRRAGAREILPLAAARANGLKTDWQSYDPPEPAAQARRGSRARKIEELVPYIDWRFFTYAWDLGLDPARKGADGKTDAEKAAAAASLRADAEALLARIASEGLLEARESWGIWPANSDGDDVVVWKDDDRKRELMRIPFLRDGLKHADPARPNLSLSDYLAPLSSGKRDWIGAFAVTAGLGADGAAESYKRAGDDYSAIMVKILADRLAEALAELLHLEVRTRLWGYADEPSPRPDDLFLGKYRGIRPAPGYPACPDHRLKAAIWKLLDPDSIGIRLTESWMMSPGASVSGFYFTHPACEYFSAGDAEGEYLRDYAARAGLSEDEARASLAPTRG